MWYGIGKKYIVIILNVKNVKKELGIDNVRKTIYEEDVLKTINNR